MDEEVFTNRVAVIAIVKAMPKGIVRRSYGVFSQEENMLQLTPEAKGVLKTVRGKVICVENGNRKAFDSGEEAAENYTSHYRVVSISAEGNEVVLEVEDMQPAINEEREKYLQEYREKYGREPNPFDGD